MIDPHYKNDLTPDNEAAEVCRKCGAPAVLWRKHGRERRYYCADHYRKTSRKRYTTYYPPIDQSPVTLTPADVIDALNLGAQSPIRGATAADLIAHLETEP